MKDLMMEEWNNHGGKVEHQMVEKWNIRCCNSGTSVDVTREQRWLRSETCDGGTVEHVTVEQWNI